MNISTKFDLGDRVQAISFSRKDKEVKCKVCKGKGEINIPEYGKSECPECYGRGIIIISEPERWFISDYTHSNFEIKRISVDLYQDKNEDNRIYYMSGTSGTMFYECDLFLTKKEAQKECDKRNTKK